MGKHDAAAADSRGGRALFTQRLSVKGRGMARIERLRQHILRLALCSLLGVAPGACIAHPGHGPGGAAGNSYADALAALDVTFRSFLEDAAKQPGSWMLLESAANTCLERAHLTGSYQDFALADSLFDRAFAVAPKGSGPLLSRATFELSVHRLDAAEALIRAKEGAAIPTANSTIAIHGARADLAFERGDYAEAKRLIDRLMKEDPGSTNLFRLANYEWHLGDSRKVDRMLARAESLYAGTSDQYRAWFRAQRGDLAVDLGNYEQALARYQEAEDLFPGWWSNYARTAHVFALQGKTEQATFAYQDLISRTNLPEMMDALAMLYQAADEAAPLARWTAKARKLHDTRTARFPEAAVGHALQHFLRLEADTKEVVRLAERNRDLRPNGEAWTWLAQAYLRDGQTAAAGTAVDRVLALGWKTPETFATASLVRKAQSRANDAAKLEREAVALNPDAMKLVAWLSPAR